MPKILIVDDIPSNREYLVTLLGYSKHELSEAADGTQALEQALLQRPALIIADIVMPTMDGFEFVRRLRSMPQIGATPVIFYTATYHESEARALARDCGVEHIITKPSEPQIILNIVNEALGLSVPQPILPDVEEFDREHLRVVTDKLSEKVTELEGVSLRLEALIEVGQQLASEHDSIRLLDTACAAAREIVGARFAVLGMVEKGGMDLKQYTVQGLDPTVIAHMSLPRPTQGVIYEALSQRRAVRARNESGDPQALGLPLDHPPVYSFLVVPIASAAQVYGWLGLRNKLGAEEFSADDERIATSLAAQTAVAYENTQRLAEIERYSAELEQRVEDRTRALQESHNQLHRAEEIGQTGSWEWLIPENRVIWSDGLCKVFGIRPDEFGATYEAYLEQVHPDDREYVRQVVNSAFLAEGPFEFESRILRGDGESRHLYTRGEMVFSEQGKPLRMIGTASDITGRKQAEDALRLENERFMRFIESNIIGIVIADATGHILLANDYYLNVLGVTRQDFDLGRVDWRKFTPPEWLPADENALRQLHERGICEPYEKEYLRADGTRDPVYIADAMISGPGEQNAAFVMDISHRKQQEIKLQESESKFSILFGESAQPAALSRLSDQVFVDVNNAWIELFGFTKEEAVGKTSLELGINRDAQRRTQTINDVRRVNSIRNWEQALYTKSGQALTALININLITIGGEDYAINSVQDITERKQMEEAFYRTTEELRRSNSELEHFAYVASHDLQEPLRKVIGFTSLLSRRYKGRLDDEADEFIGFTVEAATRMQNLIQDLLTYSRVGRTDEMSLTDCEGVLDNALGNLQVEIETSGAHILREALPTVMGNELELTQVFQNLIGNALKFHGDQKPDIYIGAERKPGEWVFSVRDNGIGLDPQFADRIFQMFQRLHRKDEYPGTGIGLAICKKVVEHHGGRIWVESTPGAGAAFFFTLPAVAL
jgi:PAS domain S-box-containing protein